MNNFYSSRKGQAIVESVVALGALTVGFLAIITLLSRSLSSYRVTTDMYIGTYLAGEGVELVKNLVDSGLIRGDAWGATLPAGEYEIDYFTDFSANPPELSRGRTLSFNEATGRYSYAAGMATTFGRTVTISYPHPDEMKVNALVNWTGRGGGTFSVDVEDHFFNWR